MNSSTVTARTTIECLVREGISTFILCPGSRSAPLAIALAQAEHAGVVDLHIETDERVAGFVALGFGKEGVPAAVVTTSGSAVANLHPAAEEALHSAIPIVFLTADRPHEMRGVRATQTTNHCAVLAGSVLHSVDLPTDLPSENSLKNQLVRTCRIAKGEGFAGGRGCGPVHINLAFRDPLVPESEWGSVHELGNVEGGPLQKPTDMPAKRTVIVAGPSQVVASPAQAQAFGETIGLIPVLAEPSSSLRCLPQAVTSHPILLSSALGNCVERAVVIGHPTLTREVSRLLANAEVEVVVMDDQPSYTDVSGNAAQVVDLESLPAWLTIDPQRFREWEVASTKVRRYLHKEEWKLGFPAIARAISQSSITTMLGASSIIREVNLYGDCPGKVFSANRGLAGIDGTVSTAIGMALAKKEPVRVVVGDLTFIHDLGALVKTSNQARLPDIQVVVINDAGGSLFATLEYGAGDTEVFDRVFRTEKTFDYVKYVKALGVDMTCRIASGDPLTLHDELDEFTGGIEVFVVNLPREEVGIMRGKRSDLRSRIVNMLQA
ncbi:2-succinyl-5-enolpyruvyl-6-hydroxy-3-cyclohexene-1-carboxylic-acid synthase [Arcanobacterium ihumii]|uniref:2-succinyl-5-enolpyruvyl-6-hydroxy-3- cyclohexene-1-carboxylic-acid synthase n=1 Tax=Arcanobacterium ihumii TaxID=2138162 RepID=UPI00135B5F46|nr:2-succinyl-5-enolpyruvyl-6-hydroxy-3-cyclohexene-1-carboxylic-acid synthase [Arcanobacterium ihumii]